MRQAVVFVALLLAADAAFAELPSIRLDRITPLGGAAGSTVEVEFAAADAEEATTLLFDHPGIKAEFLKDKRFSVTIGGDVPEGTYDAFLSGRFGISNPRLFAVSRGLTEINEKEPNDEAATAQTVVVNAAINGTSDGNRDDIFRVALKKGQRVVIDCQAAKLDSMLHGTMVLTDSSGKPLASSGPYNGRDPLIDFIASADAEYLVNLHDLSYRGGMPYRLIVTDRPQVENVFPRAVQIGKPASFAILGRNLGKDAKPSKWKIGDLQLDESAESISPPLELLGLGGYRFSEHPTTHSVLPTAATCTLTGFQVRGVPVLVSRNAVSLEVEPNDDPKKPQPLTLPAAVSGRFDQERDADWFQFEAADAGNYAFEVYCERIAGRADPYLVIVDDKDNRVAELDDFGHRINAFDGHLRDPSGSVNLQAKKQYRVLVQDRYRRGGARYQYVLTICKPTPDFYPAVIHSQNPGPGGTTIRRGGAAHLDVVVHNKDGFNGPMTITAEGLPKGLHAAPTTINNDTRGSFVIWADADAPDWTGPVKLFATAKDGDTVLKREVRAYSRVWNNNDLNSSRPMRDLVLAVRDTAPFALKFDKDRIEIEAGTKSEVKVHLQRLWPDFKSSVNVLPLSFPGSIKMGQVTIAADKNEATVTLEVQGGARPGEYTLVAQGQAQVPFAKDPKAGTRPNTLSAQPSRPVTLVVLPAMKKK